MPLEAAAARDVYDRIGRLQDSQRFYEDAATRRITELADFGGSESTFELGCGTGRFASQLLAARLPPSATYLGVDVSPRMVALARERVAAWPARARVVLLEPPARVLPIDDGAVDRFVSTYVFDLLSEEAGRALIGEAARSLVAGGLLALVSLTRGTTPASRIVSGGWDVIGRRFPRLVGGCRPIDLRELLDGPEWSLEQCETVVRFAVPSQVVLARRQPDG